MEWDRTGRRPQRIRCSASRQTLAWALPLFFIVAEAASTTAKRLWYALLEKSARDPCQVVIDQPFEGRPLRLQAAHIKDYEDSGGVS